MNKESCICGSNVWITPDEYKDSKDYGLFYIECCDCFARTPSFKTQDDAIKFWNLSILNWKNKGTKNL